MTFSLNNVNLKTSSGSLIGRLALERNEGGLSKVIQNLSTGIKINSGRDDPQGFISSSILRTEISSTKQAITNCSRASSICSAVEGALAQVNLLLNEIRTLITDAANTGVNDETILRSLQLQADACLDSIDKIANTTSFLGQKLLNGGLDFETYGVEVNKIQYLQINQADFQGRTEKDISVKVLQNAQPAVLFYQFGALNEKAHIEVGGNLGYYVYDFDKDATVDSIAQAINLLSDSTGVAATVMAEAMPGNILASSYGKDNDVIITASKPGTVEGNFVIKFTAAKEGNPNLALNVIKADGNEPTEIEVMLQTEQWKAATYHYNGENDGIANNEFDWTAKIAGSEYNDIRFGIMNVRETGDTIGLSYDLNSNPKTITINVDYDSDNPTSPENTSVNDLKGWLESDPVLSAYFSFENSPPSDGTGPIIPTTPFVQSETGADGGAIISTAEQVATLLNTSPLLLDDEGNGMITASIPAGSTGLGTVSAFQEYAYFGTLAQNNELQFLGPKGSPNIRFTSTPGTTLAIDDTSFPPMYGNSVAVVQGFDAGTTFSLKARNPGDNYDGLGVIFQDGPNESAVLDPLKNAIVITVDFSGRESDPEREAFDLLQMRTLIETSPTLVGKFDFIPSNAFDAANPPKFTSSDYVGINAKVSEMSGGLIEPGILVIQLETDVAGNVKTTAADLVNFFDNPTSEESKAILDKYAISVSLVDPTNGATVNCGVDTSRLGLGYLTPTFSDSCDENGNMLLPDISFTCSGIDTIYDYPYAEVESKNGLNAGFSVTALTQGPEFNNINVRIVNNPGGQGVKYEINTKELIISIDASNPPSANTVIDMINGDANVSKLFRAANVPFSDGQAVVAAGDHATLTGGVKIVTNIQSTITTAENGIDSVLQITGKKTDGSTIGASVKIVDGSGNPSVQYDPISKQLSIAIDPRNPMTAAEVVDLVNNTDGVNELFTASIPKRLPGTLLTPSGEGLVRSGDGGTLASTLEGTSRGAPMIGNADSSSVGLAIYSVDFGANSFVSVRSIQGTNFPLLDVMGNVAEKSVGNDVVAMINNLAAIGSGQVASMSTTDLDISIWIDPSVVNGDVFGFRITGGGALMQLGPEPNSNSQSRIAFKDIHTTKLGGPSGFLSELRTGGEKDLLTNTKGAFKVIDEVIEEIAFLRGQIGAFQKNQVERNANQMGDIVEIATSADSVIRDTDFALASSELARLDLMIQASISVLRYPGEMARQILGLLQ